MMYWRVLKRFLRIRMTTITTFHSSRSRLSVRHLLRCSQETYCDCSAH